MEIIVKNGAVMAHQMKKEVAKPAALNKLQKIYNREKIKAEDKWYRSRIDSSESAKNAKIYGKNLEKVIPEKLSPEVKDAMWRRAKLLKDEFVIGMLSKEENHPVRGFEDKGTMKWVVDEEKIHALKSIERNTAWYKKNEAKLREFKNLMRHLCPEDPNAGDIERFRPKLRGIR